MPNYHKKLTYHIDQVIYRYRECDNTAQWKGTHAQLPPANVICVTIYTLNCATERNEKDATATLVNNMFA